MRPDAGLQGYVEAVPLAAVLVDRQGRIRALNSAWRRQAQHGALVDPADDVGRDHLHALRDKGFHSAAGKELARLVEGVLDGRRDVGVMEYRLLDDDDVLWEATASRIEIAQEPLVMLVHRDRSLGHRTTRMSERLDDVVMEREQQAAVARDRQRLLAAGQQSFHAPITPVRLQLHLLKNGALGELGERQMRAVERIERNVHRWWHLQQRMLEDLQALEDPQHEVDDADLGELLDEALQPFGERALKAGIRLRVDRAEEGLEVRVDRRAVVQAMMVLLDHAVRHTSAGGTVWVRLRPVGRDVEWRIHDQDPCMDPVQAEALLSDQGQQTGLRHVRGVLARQGGTMSVHCPGAGHGLEVCATLPGR